MSLLKTFTATAAITSFSFRIEKALQHIDFQRVSGNSVTRDGLEDGFPEIISAEITHPVRKRVRNANDTPLSHIALWAQHGRGPMSEYYDSGSAESLIDLRFKYYLNDLGPVEILADDHFVVKVENCIPGATYNIYGPEQQVVAVEGNKYFTYETAIILASDRERNLSTAGKQGIILPNRPEAIERIVITSLDDNGNRFESELDLVELMAVQADQNPFVSVLSDAYTVTRANGSKRFKMRAAALASSQLADYFLVMFHNVVSIQIDTTLGDELAYTMIGVADRV